MRLSLHEPFLNSMNNNIKKHSANSRVKSPFLKSKPKSSSKTKKKKQGGQVLRSSVPLNLYKPKKDVLGTTRSHSLRLTPCALRFAAAIADPFGVAAQGACIPSAPAINSQKVHSFVRFDATVGTNGMGFITIHPCIANDGLLAYYTGPTFAGTSAAPLTASNVLATGVSRLSPAGLPYSTAQCAAPDATKEALAFGRIVAVGVRMWYTGTTLNESGLTYCYVSPNHMPATQIPNGGAPMTIANLSTYDQTEISPLTRNQCSLSVFPVSRNEMEYLSPTTPAASSNTDYNSLQLYPYSSGYVNMMSGYTDTVASVYAGAPPAIIMFTGYSGNSVHVEIIQHIEYTGQLTAGRTTRDTADEEGAGQVMAAANIMQMEMTNNAGLIVKPTMWSMMYSALGQVGNAALKIAVPAAEKALSALLL